MIDIEAEARQCYVAYGDFVEWKNYAGLPMPTWEELPEKIRGAWRASIGHHREQLATTKIQKFEDDPSLTWEERYRLLQIHHVQETSILTARLKDPQPLYFESHVTIEPVEDERLERLKTVAAKYDFRVADLLLARPGRNPEKSKRDSFTTGRGNSFEELAGRMKGLVDELQDEGFQVWRYKVETAILDIRIPQVPAGGQ